MKKIVSKDVVFRIDSFSFIRKNETIEVNYSDIEKIIYIRSTFWNWLTGRTHAVIPGRIHVFLKSDKGNNKYSLIIPNDMFENLPRNLVNKLPTKYKNY